MKLMKRMGCMILALTMVLGFVVVPTTEVSAASKATVSSKVRVYDGDWDDNAISVKYANKGDQIKNVKSSSKNMIAKVTTQHTSSSDIDDNYANIGIYTKKAGTFKVTFDVYSKDGKTKRSSHKVTVYAKSDSPIKNVTFAGKSNFYSITTAKTGKIAVSMNKGYTLKKIQVITYDKNGNEVVKTVKNKSKITLGLYSFKSSYGDDISAEYYYSYMYTSMFASTEIEITYIDKYTKKSATTSYTLYRLVK